MHSFVLLAVAAFEPPPPPQATKEFETLYNMVRTDDIFMLKRSDLDLGSNLGKGNFGSVMRGTYRLRGKVIDVAVKVLKANDAAAEVGAVLFLTLLPLLLMTLDDLEGHSIVLGSVIIQLVHMCYSLIKLFST